MKNTNDFSKCKVGQKLWSIQLGECEISYINSDIITCNGYMNISYFLDGKCQRKDSFQSLFFSQPEIIAPEKPKERIPFDLELALQNPDSLVTRDGRKVVEWKWFEKADQNYDCIVYICDGELFSCILNGHYIDNDDDERDLFIEL